MTVKPAEIRLFILSHAFALPGLDAAALIRAGIRSHFLELSDWYAENLLQHICEEQAVLLIHLREDDRKLLDWLRACGSLNLPPILVLGKPQSDWMLQGLIELGISSYLLPPIDTELLILKVRALLYQQRQLRHTLTQKHQLEQLLHTARREGEMASHIFYRNLVGQGNSQIEGFDRYIQASTDFCADLVLARTSPSGSLFILHADAMGHGLSATITLMDLVEIFDKMVDKGYVLQMIVREINRKLHIKLPPDRFLAASLTEIDALHEQISVWNGGMPPVCLLCASGTLHHQFDSRHLALGILEDALFDVSVERIPMPVEGALFSISDGILKQVGGTTPLAQVLSLLAAARREHLMGDLCQMLGLNPGQTSAHDVSFFHLDLPTLIDSVMQQGSLPCATSQCAQIAPFHWSLTLYGQQLARQELATQANVLLRDMGMSQPFCQRSFTVISELLNNALDHGLLGLSSELKGTPEGFTGFLLAREQGLQQLQPDDWLSLRLIWQSQPARLLVEVEHSGAGFDVDARPEKPANEFSGRGLLLIQRLAVSLVYEKDGRLARASLE